MDRMMKGGSSGRTGLLAALVAAGSVAACQPAPDLTLPTVDQVETQYASIPGLDEVEINGNVATVVVRQSADQLRRGGTLWAKVGPYIYLFSEETRQLFEDYSGLAAVRVITRTGSDVTVANALLARDELNDILWRRSLNISGLARRDGTERISLIEDLIHWGEAHTEFEYNERYIQRR